MYKQILNRDGSVCDFAIMLIADNATIPFDPANTDYQAFLRWCEEGNTPEPASAE